jgi:hypothetical protein
MLNLASCVPLLTCLRAGTFETRGDYLYTYLGTAGITETTCKQFADLLDEAATTLLAKQVGVPILAVPSTCLML